MDTVVDISVEMVSFVANRSLEQLQWATRISHLYTCKVVWSNSLVRGDDGRSFAQNSLVLIYGLVHIMICASVCTFNATSIFTPSCLCQGAHKTFRLKRTLAHRSKMNRPVPQWIRLRTNNRIRYAIVLMEIGILILTVKHSH